MSVNNFLLGITLANLFKRPSLHTVSYAADRSMKATLVLSFLWNPDSTRVGRVVSSGSYIIIDLFFTLILENNNLSKKNLVWSLTAMIWQVILLIFGFFLEKIGTFFVPYYFYYVVSFLYSSIFCTKVFSYLPINFLLKVTELKLNFFIKISSL